MGGYLIFGVANLVIFIGVGVYFLRRPTKNYLSNRSREFESREQQARNNLGDAKEEHGQMVERLKNINDEMRGLMDGAEEEGERVGEKMLIRAEGLADRVITESETRADSEFRRAEKNFYKELVRYVIAKAEKDIKKQFSVEDQLRFSRGYLKLLCERKGIGN